MQPQPDPNRDTDTLAGADALTLGVRPVWQILDEARRRGFTGEIVFQLPSPVVAYLDAGVVYLAERVDEPPISERLVSADVIDADTLRQGAVRVGSVEHLGRLFERMPDLDRDAIVVGLEIATEELVAELANSASCDIRYTAYRHHPSGVHRWFAGPRPYTSHAEFTPTPTTDRTMIEDLAGLPLTPDGSAGQLYIEWDEPILGLDGTSFESTTVDFPEHEIAADLAEQQARLRNGPDVEDWTEQVDVSDETVVYDEPLETGRPSRDGDSDDLGDVELDDAIDVVVDDEPFDDVEPFADVEPFEDVEPFDEVAAEPHDEVADEASTADASPTWTALPVPNSADMVAEALPVVETDGINFRIELQSVGDDVVPTASAEEARPDDGSPGDDGEQVAQEVAAAEAVRRALSAIEQATIEWDDPDRTGHANNDAAGVNGTVEDDAGTPADLPQRWDPEPVASGSPFAPPTLDMSAEAMYARSRSVADETDRTSALRRLIGGLRRK